jgi:hypothetical protein
VGCLRLISGNRAWQDSTTLSKSKRALFSTSTGCVSCRWTTHLTPNKRHFPQMQALGAQECKGAGWKQQLHCRSLGRVSHFLYVQPEKPCD